MKKQKSTGYYFSTENRRIGEIEPVSFTMTPETNENITSDISIDGNIKCDNGFFTFCGVGKVKLSAECATCLKPIETELVFDINENFCDSQSVLSGHEDDNEFFTFTGRQIDFTDAINTNISMAMPARFVCTEECKGLCIKCGEDLNEGNCDCESDIDERFSMLDNIISKEM